ncbi:MAG: aspartate carbamoyltransferase [Firmicutes bacterium]|nr:aspartate carbamoyltransferase [Bacillota bacterium]
MRHVISARQFDRTQVERLLTEAAAMEGMLHGGPIDLLRGRVMAALFFEPSTRTRLSFETAMLRLGGSVISTENAREFSSAIKGESLEDTIAVVSGYADVIVLRHHEIGAAARAASVSRIPVLSAGDGAGEHPTQALLDLYSIRAEVGRLDGITVVLAGDLLYGRTVHSLLVLLALFDDVRVICCSPEQTPLPQDLADYAEQRGVRLARVDDLRIAVAEADVVYQTRVQKERFEDADAYQAAASRHVIDVAMLTKMKPDAALLHPLPRAGEIAADVDRDPRAAYFRQSHRGVPLRMALLANVLGQVHRPFTQEPLRSAATIASAHPGVIG